MNPNSATPSSSPFDANSIMANVSANQAQANQPQQPTQPQHSGNWFTHLLPTIGSIAIPALGALLAPETGGLSLLAAAGLSGAGAAAGKAGENAVEGKSIGNNVVGEGLMGAAGGAAGGIAGKVIGKAAGALGSTAENLAAKEATQTAAQEGIDTAANTYKDISPQLQKALNMKDSLEHVKNMGYGIEDPNNLVHVGTTSNDILNETLNRALANSGPVDLSHYPQIVKDALAKESGTLGSFEPVAVAKGRLGTSNTPASKLLQQLETIGNAPGETTGSAIAKFNADPNELRTLTSKLGNLAQDAKPTMAAATGAVDPQQRAIYNVINDVRGNVKDALYNRPQVSDALKGEIGNLTANPEMNITPELADHLNGVITNSGDAQSLLDEISKNINIKRLGEEGNNVGQIVTSTGAKARAAAEAGLDTGGSPATGNSMLDMAGLVNPHAGMVSGAIGAVKHVAQNPGILSTLSRIGAMGAKLAPATGAAIATSPNLQADPVAVDPNAAGGMGMAAGGTNGTMEGNMNGAYAPSDTTGLMHAIAGLSVLDPNHYGAQGQSLLALEPFLQKNQLAASAIHGIPQSFANAGGAQGTGGILSHIAALIPGTAAHTYNAQREAAAAQLAQVMGISPQQAMGLLPEVMQNQQTAGMTQGILSNMGGQLAY